jgi:hypothetical protein
MDYQKSNSKIRKYLTFLCYNLMCLRSKLLFVF